MELRFAKDSDNVQDLWQQVFPGETAYFGREYRPSQTLLQVSEDGLIVSMLHWTRGVLSLWGEDVPTAYILGVATMPEYRGKGLAGELIEQVLFELHLRGVPLAALIPSEQSMAGFYKEYGFVPLGARMAKGEKAGAGKAARTEDIPELNVMYEKKMAGRPFFKRSALQWAVILEEYKAELFQDGYAVFDGDVCMESSSGVWVEDHPTAACLRVVKAKYMLELAKRKAKPVPETVFDEWCPWNHTGGTETDEPLERVLFKNDRPYMNLLYNAAERSEAENPAQ